MGPTGSRDHGKRIVKGVEVQINELIWADGGRSFEVFRTKDEEDLTIDGCFDELPTNKQIEALFDAFTARKQLN
jgi:hypothetical protein